MLAIESADPAVAPDIQTATTVAAPDANVRVVGAFIAKVEVTLPIVVPVYAMTTPITHYDYCSLMILLLAVFKADE